MRACRAGGGGGRRAARLRWNLRGHAATALLRLGITGGGRGPRFHPLAVGRGSVFFADFVVRLVERDLVSDRLFVKALGQHDQATAELGGFSGSDALVTERALRRDPMSSPASSVKTT